MHWFKKWLIKKVYNFSLYLITWFKPNSEYIDLIDNFILTNFANKNYHSELNNFYFLPSITYKDEMQLELTLINRNDLKGKILYIHYYYAILSNQDFINFAPVKVFIARAESGTKGFTLHKNFLYIKNIGEPTLNKFLIHIEPNLNFLLSMNYFNDAPEKLIVTVWDVTKATRLKINKYPLNDIQISILETIKKTFNKPLKINKVNFPFHSSINFFTNKLNLRTYNSRENYFTPLIDNKHNYFENDKNIVAVDIETMFLNDSTRHVPVLITIAHYNNNNKLKTNFFLINIHDIKMKVMNKLLIICDKISSIIYSIILILHQLYLHII